MRTYFASPERTVDSQLREEIRIVNSSPLMKVFLNSINGLLAVIDENRQIVSVNDRYLSQLGISDPEKVLGLRTGESLNCVHADEMPGGCGTSRYCRTCGSAIAITTCLVEDRAVERECALETVIEGKKRDLYMQIKCEPVNLEGKRFLLLFLYDNTKEQQRKMLERTFFHDFSNILGGLSANAYMLSRGLREEKIIEAIETTTNILVKEIEVQRCFRSNDLDFYDASFYPISPESMFSKLESIFKERIEKENKSLIFKNSPDVKEIKSDEILLIRIISNMITNALEATKEKGRIAVFTEKVDDQIKVSVHNNEYIPDEIQLRIFQKNFSTKGNEGRGIGTYSMKLFGEQVLKGEVGFLSTTEWGTEFYVKLPS